ncbi:MFS transporter [Siccirubricoccus sp. KC 17139]|uniref:MFS transporter n=1 Tax=Siccirubricoccus soli TaxID=2899147 RepID=A0ABT1DC16_9PROT|nr:MFS transporter [Siccirubricoccus soli]MCP2685616.1 MFS transporter [Siccirubricoccus soli]
MGADGAAAETTAGVLPRYLLLYGLIFAAYGVEGPFLPALLAERGLSATAIGLLLAAGTAARLVSAPAVALAADRFGAPRLLLAGALLASALFGCGFALAGSLVGLLLVSLLVSLALAPVNPLADALTSSAAERGGGFRYGVVRGAGSAAFVAGTTLAGPVVAGSGLEAVVWLNAALLAAAAVMVLALPVAPARPRPVAPRAAEPGAMRQLLGLVEFRRLLLVTGLVQGSHALYGAFATLRWQAAGIGPEVIGALWAVAVASEVAVFLLLGPWLLARLGPARLAALAAAAGVLRWAAMAMTADPATQFLLQPLHGLTFAALHLATMRLLAERVPPRLAASAFGLQATLGPGLAGALLTLAAGPLYGAFGAGGFWAMALLCVGAVPLALRLGGPGERPSLPAVLLLPRAAPPAA